MLRAVVFGGIVDRFSPNTWDIRSAFSLAGETDRTERTRFKSILRIPRLITENVDWIVLISVA